MKRNYMDFAILWLPGIGFGVLIAISISAWFAEKKIAAIWFGFGGTVCLLLLLALQLHNAVREAGIGEPLSPEAAARKVFAAAEVRSQRAWISVVPRLANEIKIGAPITIELIADNVGKEPATGVSHHGMAMMFDMPEQIGYAPEIWSPQFGEIIRLECDLAVPQKGKTTIFPGQKPVLQSRWDNPNDIEALIAGKKILVNFGCLGYFVGDEAHYTWYCFFLVRDSRGNWQLGSAPIGNDAN
jgi:hypothetical protein